MQRARRFAGPSTVTRSPTPRSPEVRVVLLLHVRVRSRGRTSGPINAIFFDWKHGSFWGGSGNHGEDYGIAWGFRANPPTRLCHVGAQHASPLLFFRPLPTSSRFVSRLRHPSARAVSPLDGLR